VEILAQSSADFAFTYNFRALIYWAHRAVIFAIAWLLVLNNVLPPFNGEIETGIIYIM